MVATNDARSRQPSLAFGHFLKRHRGVAELTQEELAERAGVSARLISDLERGLIQRPRRETVQQLANGLDLSGADRETFAALARGLSLLGVDAAPPDTRRPRNRLPIPPSPIVGRLKETAAAMALLLDQEISLLTLTGPGGVGKTRLAIEVATNIQDVSPDGTSFVDLAPVSDARLVLQAIARAIGLKTTREQELRDRLAGALGSKRLLLVLDNVEHVAEAAGEIAWLLGECSQLTILATSRAPLRLRAEREYRVEPLALPNLDAPLPLDEFARIPAVELFLNRIGAANRDFVLSAANARAVAEITVRLDGLPLALELAAARAKVLPPAAILHRLERRLPLLTGGARDLPTRLQAMRSAIDWSHELLHPSEQRLFRRLAVFVGGATLQAAEWMIDDVDPSSSSALDDLSALVDKSLLHVVADAGDERRFGMLATLREYGLERLVATDEDVGMRGRHAAWCLDLAERAEQELMGPDQAAWFTRLEIEHDNLRAALRWAIERRNGELAARLGGALRRFWNLRGHSDEGRRWLEETLALGDNLPSAVRAKAYLAVGVIAYRQGDYDRATALEEALSLYRGLGDTGGVAAALCNLGLVAQDQREYDRATALAEEALALVRALGDQSRIGNLLENLGLAAYDRGDYERARGLLEEALALAGMGGNRHSAAFSLNNLALVALAQGDHARARPLQREALELWRHLGNKDGLAHSFENLAQLASERDDSARAIRLFAAAETLRGQIGAPGRRIDRERIQRILRDILAHMGDAAFAKAWDAGRAMTLDEAISYAVGGRI